MVIVVIQTLTEKLNRKSFAVGRSPFLLRESVVAVNMHVRFDSRVALTRAIRKATKRLKFRSNYRIRLGPSWDMATGFPGIPLVIKSVSCKRIAYRVPPRTAADSGMWMQSCSWWWPCGRMRCGIVGSAEK